jgi:hypothetical protein
MRRTSFNTWAFDLSARRFVPNARWSDYRRSPVVKAKGGTVMSDATRRGFLVFAGAGTAAAVTAVAAPQIFTDRPAEAAPQLAPADLADAESFVVHVKDVRKGQMAIMVGQREVLVTDHELAARLAGKTMA